MKTVFRLSALAMIGLLCVAGCAKQKVDVPPGPPEGMVLIPAGDFQMGNNAPVARKDEQPVHTVYIDAFFMDKYEVTNAQYQEFVLANPSWQKGRIDRRFHDVFGCYLQDWNGNDYPIGEANHAVAWVSWYAAMAYSPSGPENDCQRRRNGKGQPGEAWWGRNTHGVIPLILAR